ncbi:Maltase 1 [Gryllus bimaculatus]|nr:Maltase 1 [Gryllus bimaculatus]
MASVRQSWGPGANPESSVPRGEAQTARRGASERGEAQRAERGGRSAGRRVLKFWFDLGVDGFRVDAVPQMAEDACFRDEEPAGNDLPPYDYEYLTHKVLMLETYGPIDEVVDYYGTTEHPGGHFPFNFYFITELKNTSSAQDLDRIVHKWMDNIKAIDWPNWVLGNHDQRRVATRFGPQLADAMNMLSLLLPGTAITFMGEELAMEDHLGITWEETQDPWAINAGPDEYMVYSRDPERTPFQWDNTVSAGFSTNPKTWLPVNPNYEWLNAENQLHLRLTHVLVYKDLVRLRQLDAFRRGSLTTAVVGDVFAFSRVYGDEAYVVAINLGGTKETVDLSVLSPLPNLAVSVSSINSFVQYATFPADAVVLQPYAALALRSYDTSS